MSEKSIVVEESSKLIGRDRKGSHEATKEFRLAADAIESFTEHHDQNHHFKTLEIPTTNDPSTPKTFSYKSKNPKELKLMEIDDYDFKKFVDMDDGIKSFRSSMSNSVRATIKTLEFPTNLVIGARSRANSPRPAGLGSVKNNFRTEENPIMIEEKSYLLSEPSVDQSTIKESAPAEILNQSSSEDNSNENDLVIQKTEPISGIVSVDNILSGKIGLTA